jgi:hypothetical protein
MRRRFGHWRKARQDSNPFLSLVQLAARYLRGAGRVQKACVIPSGIFVISLRIKTGNRRGHKQLFAAHHPMWVRCLEQWLLRLAYNLTPEGRQLCLFVGQEGLTDWIQYRAMPGLACSP